MLSEDLKFYLSNFCSISFVTCINTDHTLVSGTKGTAQSLIIETYDNFCEYVIAVAFSLFCEAADRAETHSL